jgi:hypothetical protein
MIFIQSKESKAIFHSSKSLPTLVISKTMKNVCSNRDEDTYEQKNKENEVGLLLNSQTNDKKQLFFHFYAFFLNFSYMFS